MIARRLARLAERTAAVRPPVGGTMAAVWHRAVAAFVARIPLSQRPAVAAALADPARAEYLADWVTFPVARGAAMPDEFPPALVDVMLTDPAAAILHACERCGLGIPIRAGAARPPGAPLILFPACPGCGGPTGYSSFRPDAGDPPRGATS